MRVIAFITYSADIRHMLAHIGAETEPPRITPACGPPLWAEAHAGSVKVWRLKVWKLKLWKLKLWKLKVRKPWSP